MMLIFDVVDARRALGPIYSPSIPLPLARYSLPAPFPPRRSEFVSSKMQPSGPEREQSWTDVWAQRLEAFESSGYSISALEPPYVSASAGATVRLFGEYAQTETRDFEMRVYEYIRETMFRSLMADFERVHDVGAGTCFNSVAFCRLNPRATVHAYDWAPATSQIASALREKHSLQIYGHHFNFFGPSLSLGAGDVVVTTCALEQAGTNWRPFLDCILASGAGRVVHLEPIYEKYDRTIEFDAVAAEYHVQRNYVRGYYPELKRLEAEGRIRVLVDHRTGIGSRFHECYTILAWEVSR